MRYYFKYNPKRKTDRLFSTSIILKMTKNNYPDFQPGNQATRQPKSADKMVRTFCTQKPDRTTRAIE